MKPRLFLLDGNALLHRAWHAIPPLATKDGLVVNAVYGFTNVIEKLRKEFTPDAMAIAWDLPGATFRHEAFAPYKAQREKKEQELYDQIPMIQEVMRAYHIPSYSAKGYEADDVMGTLSLMGEKNGYEVVIVTGDMDALQLIDDSVRVLGFVKGLSETKLWDEQAVKEKYGLTPKEMIEYKALRGDTSDNIPGVAGIGEKGGAELIQKYGSVEAILNALKKGILEEKYAKKFRGQEDVARQARMLVEIVRNVSFKSSFEEMKTRNPELEKLLDLFRKYEFRTLLKKYQTNFDDQEIAPPPMDANPGRRVIKTSSHKTPVAEAKRVNLVRNVDELEVALLRVEHESLAVMLGTQTPDLFGSTLAAVALSDGAQTVCVQNPTKEMQNKIVEKMVSSHTLISHDLKTLLRSLTTHHSPLTTLFDTMIASYLLHAGEREDELSETLYRELRVKIELPQTFTTEKEIKLLGECTAHLIALQSALRKKLAQTNQEYVFDQIEMPLIPVLCAMEEKGIEVDTKALGVFSKDLAKNIATLEKRIRQLAGEEVNVNSPSQLAHVLFETLGLSTKNIKKTKTGYSTAASELEKLMDEHEIVPLISEYRELAKLQSTYVEALPKLVAKDGRVHTTYHQAVTATGRLSSTDPNLQNIPIRTELGREIRKAFVAAKDCVLVSADYSQIELRLVAILAHDRPFIEAFKSGADIHTRTASEVWEIPESEVTKEQRRAAKAINFGIMYGMGPRSLSRSTGLSMAEAKQFIDKYFHIHHAVRSYLDQLKQKAHEQGFVETYFGRRRYFPEIDSGIQMLVAQSERMAQNMPIQGTQADVVKMAMIAVSGWLKQSQLRANILLQVHDELVLEVHKDDAELVEKGLKEMMEGVAEFEVPLEVEVKTGKNWGEMEKR